jgi:two-component system response regulator NreC
MEKIRVLLIDDHQMVREGLCVLLQNEPDIEIAGQAKDGRHGLAMIPKERPDVVVMDLKMPGLNGLEATLRIQQSHPHIHVVVLSMYSTQEHIYQALQAGASGFVAKEEACEELVTAIRTVCADRVYLSPTIRRQAIQEYIRRAQADRGPDSFQTLTPREREVLQLIAEEHNTRQIGTLLNISPKTVESHRSHLMSKLGIHTTAGLTRYAISRGVVALAEVIQSPNDT